VSAAVRLRGRAFARDQIRKSDRAFAALEDVFHYSTRFVRRKLVIEK
jgi:hypothetical protein